MSDRHGPTIRMLAIRYAALALLLAATWWVFRPDAGLVDFNSDTAIPVIMSNNKDFSPFDIYYWAQDRFGGLPMLILKTIGVTTGIRWSAFGLFGLMLMGLVGSSALCHHLGGSRFKYFVPLVAIIPGLIFPKVGAYFFGVEQVYGWALIFLLPTILLLLRVMEYATQDVPTRTGIWLSTGLLAFSFLSIWQSFTCLFYLLFAWAFLLLVILFQSHRKYRDSLLWLCFGLLPLWAGFSLERKLHRIHAKWSFNTYGLKMVTPSDIAPVAIWWPHMQASFKNWEDSGILEIGYISIVGSLAIMIHFAWGMLFKRRYPSSVLVIPLLAGMAVITFCAAIVSTWVAMNLHNTRYFGPTFLFGWAAILLTIWEIYRSLRPQDSGLLDYIILFSAVALAARPLSHINTFQPSQHFVTTTKTAENLVQSGVNYVIGSYWGSYLYEASDTSGRLTALPLDGQYQRTPWLVKALDHEGESIALPHVHLDDNFMIEGQPPLFLEQYGRLLRFDRSHGTTAEGAPISIYKVVQHLDLGSLHDIVQKRMATCEEGSIPLTSLIDDTKHLDRFPSHLIFRSSPQDLKRWTFTLQSESKTVPSTNANKLMIYHLTQDTDPQRTLVKWSWRDKGTPGANDHCHTIHMTLAI